MKKLTTIMLALMALVISVPAVMARDANRDSMRDAWSSQVNLEKQQARIEGLKHDTAVNIVVPDIAKPGAKTKMKDTGR